MKAGQTNWWCWRRLPAPSISPPVIQRPEATASTPSPAASTLGALLVGFPADRRLVAGIGGDAWLDPATMCVPVLGVQNGSLTWATSVPAIWPWPTQFRWQGLVFENGVLRLTGPGAAVLH